MNICAPRVLDAVQRIIGTRDATAAVLHHALRLLTSPEQSPRITAKRHFNKEVRQAQQTQQKKARGMIYDTRDSSLRGW